MDSRLPNHTVSGKLSRVAGLQEAYHAKKGVHQLDLNILNGKILPELQLGVIVF